MHGNDATHKPCRRDQVNPASDIGFGVQQQFHLAGPLDRTAFGGTRNIVSAVSSKRSSVFRKGTDAS
jgi:hypothetical protein